MTDATATASAGAGVEAPMPTRVKRMLRPKPRWSISEWAEKKPFRVTEKGSAAPGPYDLSLTPFWREPMDMAGDPTVDTINIVASSQIGKTLMGMVIAAYYIERIPINQLYVRPTLDDVVEAFSQRFKIVIEDNLAAHIPPQGEWVVTSKNPVIHLDRCTLYGAAATVARQLTSRTTGFNWFDEVDSGGEASNSLGSVWDLMAERRMAVRRGLGVDLGSSTPKYEDGPNYNMFQNRSDARRYFEPCPHCGLYQAMELKQIVTEAKTKDPDAIRIEDLARYQCRGCKKLIEPEYQGWMADRGVWVPRHCRTRRRLPLAESDIVERRALTLCRDEDAWGPGLVQGKSYRPIPRRGYHAWRANAKFDRCSWSNILASWFEARASRDAQKMQVYINNWLAEPYKMGRNAADEDTIRSHRGALPGETVPMDAKVILGAIDQQDDHLWYLFKAVSPTALGPRWHTVSYGIVEVRNRNHLEAYEWLYSKAMLTGWPVNGQPGFRMRAYAYAVDAGDNPDAPYVHSMRPGVIAVKGRDIADWRVRHSSIEARNLAAKVDLYHLNKRVLLDRLERLMGAGGGGPDDLWVLPSDVSEEYIEQMASETLKPRKSSPTVKTWQPKTGGRANHLRDCEAYIQGLAELLEQRQELSVMGLRATDPAEGLFREQDDPLGALRPSEPPRPDQGPAAPGTLGTSEPGYLDRN